MTFHFAWSTGQDTFDTERHAREDVAVLSMTISHGEGEFPLAVIKTPIGAMETSIERFYGMGYEGPVQTFLSYRDACDIVHFLFYGFLRRDSAEIRDEEVLWEFTAETPNARDKVVKAQQSLKEGPYWEPLVVPLDDQGALDEILDARPELPHWDRLTGELTFAPILTGDTHLDIGCHYFKDGCTWQAAPPFLERVVIEAHVEWLQRFDGVSDLSTVIKEAFSGRLIGTFTPEGLITNWWSRFHPLVNTGYEILESAIQPVTPPATGGLALYPLQSDPIRIKETAHTIPCFWLEPRFVVGWHYRQKRAEMVTIDLSQKIEGESEGRIKTITIQLEDVTDGQGFEPAAGRFFETERGEQVVRHLIQKALTYLEASRRGDIITVEVPFETLMTMSCRHTVSIHHPHRPGEILTGKVVFYELRMEGDTGEKIGRLSFVLIRKRTVASEEALQGLREGKFKLDGPQGPIGGIDDPRHLGPADLIENLEIINSLEDQKSFLSCQTFQTLGHVEHKLTEQATRLRLRLKDLKPEGVMKRCLKLAT